MRRVNTSTAGDEGSEETSTEPHSLECGECTFCPHSSTVFLLQRSRTRWSAESHANRRQDSMAVRLQRSRTRWSAERIFPVSAEPFPPLTSTEPHSLECGEGKQVFGSCGSSATSTEPHSLECGEAAAAVGVLAFDETSTEPHSLECGESTPMRSPSRAPAYFNGAALVGVRRETRLAPARRTVASTSTEPHSLECGEDTCACSLGPSHSNFNGAALVGVRRAAASQASAFSRVLLQRSRTRWSAESTKYEGEKDTSTI